MDAETFKVAQNDSRNPRGRQAADARSTSSNGSKGEIWANVWHSEQPETLGKPNYIARIDPATGKLLGWVNLAGISPDDQPSGNDPDDPKRKHAQRHRL